VETIREDSHAPGRNDDDDDDDDLLQRHKIEEIPE